MLSVLALGKPASPKKTKKHKALVAVVTWHPQNMRVIGNNASVCKGYLCCLLGDLNQLAQECISASWILQSWRVQSLSPVLRNPWCPAGDNESLSLIFYWCKIKSKTLKMHNVAVTAHMNMDQRRIEPINSLLACSPLWSYCSQIRSF